MVVSVLAFASQVLAVEHDLKPRLQASAKAEQKWANLWGGTWGVATAGQAVGAAFVKDKDLQLDLAFGAASAALGLIPTVIYRPWILRNRRLIEPLTGESRDAYYARLEEVMRLDIADKQSRRGVWAHTGNVAINLGLGAVQAFGFKHYVSGLLNVVIGIPVGTAMILSQPEFPETAPGKVSVRDRTKGIEWRFRPVVSFRNWGLQFSGAFF